MRKLTVPAKAVNDYADLAALCSDSLRLHCVELIKNDWIEKVKLADEVRQETGRKYFDLDAKLAPTNWHTLTHTEKNDEYEAREKQLNASDEGKAFKSAEEDFFKVCQELALLDRDERLTLVNGNSARDSLYESLVFQRVDKILDQKLFYEDLTMVKNKNDKRRAAIIFSDSIIEEFVDKIIEGSKSDVPFKEYELVFNFAVQVVIEIMNVEDMKKINCLMSDVIVMSNRAKVKSIQTALTDTERSLYPYIKLFAENEGFSLTYAPESIAESISRSQFLKRREVVHPPKNVRRVC